MYAASGCLSQSIMFILHDIEEPLLSSYEGDSRVQNCAMQQIATKSASRGNDIVVAGQTSEALVCVGARPSPLSSYPSRLDWSGEALESSGVGLSSFVMLTSGVAVAVLSPKNESALLRGCWCFSDAEGEDILSSLSGAKLLSPQREETRRHQLRGGGKRVS